MRIIGLNAIYWTFDGAFYRRKVLIGQDKKFKTDLKGCAIATLHLTIIYLARKK